MHSTTSTCIRNKNNSCSYTRVLSRQHYSTRLISFIFSCTLFLGILLSHSGLATGASRTHMSRRIVKTQYGDVRGILIMLPPSSLPTTYTAPSSAGREVEVEAYIGLEYASLLEGELRFMPPTSPVSRWQDVKFAGKFRPVCPQKLPNIEELKRTAPPPYVEHIQRILPFLESQHEECLNLNIYTPAAEPGRKPEPLLPVLLLVHGENFMVGSGNAYDGSALAGYGNIIVITLNYRLGVLGFLNTGDTNAPGNSGLLDIVAALHWIADNIEAFGGDPKAVTVLGHKYGAALVNLLMISPITKGRGLFKRVILQSGSALSSWAISSDVSELMRAIADKLNCSQVIDKPMMFTQCLKGFKADELAKIEVPVWKYVSSVGPTVDGRGVVPHSVRAQLNGPEACRHEFGKTPLLLGVQREEGRQFMSSDDLHNGVTDERLQQILRTYVQNTFLYHQQKIYDILLHNYNGWDRPRDRYLELDDLAQLMGDGQVVAPVIELAQCHAYCGYQSPTYLYSFERPARAGQGGGSRDRSADWDSTSGHRKYQSGASSGDYSGSVSFFDDLGFVLGSPLVDRTDPFHSNYSDADRGLAIMILTYWTNFIKTGNPNEFEIPVGRKIPPLRPLTTTWSEYDINKQLYMSFGANPKMDNHYRSKMMGLWLDLLPAIHRPDAFDPVYHLLDHNDNLTTFESRGTRPVDLNKLRAGPPTTTTEAPLPSPTDHNRGSGRPRGKSTTVAKPKRPTVPPPRPASPTPASAEPVETGGQASSSKTSEDSNQLSSISLGSTVAVGLALLILNILVFAAAYCQWLRLRRTRADAKSLPDQRPMNDVEYVGTLHRHNDVDNSVGFENNCSNPVTGTLLKEDGMDGGVTTLPNNCRQYKDRPITTRHHRYDEDHYHESLPLRSVRNSDGYCSPLPTDYAVLTSSIRTDSPHRGTLSRAWENETDFTPSPATPTPPLRYDHTGRSSPYKSVDRDSVQAEHLCNSRKNSNYSTTVV